MADFDPEAVEVVTFDSYGTLVDTGASARVLDGLVDDPDAVAAEWRRKALFYSVVAEHVDAYETYFEFHVDGLRDALAAVDVTLPDERLRELTGVYHDLDPYAGVREGFERLDEAGYRPSICSNGNPEMLDSLVETVGIEGVVHELVSADDVRTLKPDAALYEHAADRVGVPTSRVAHVTAHWMDVVGAEHAGMQGVWLDRGGQWPSFDGDPSLVVDSVPAVPDRLGV